MEYLQETLDRATGRLTTRSIGDWITVTELGERYCVGPRKVRAVLHHIGILGHEGRRYRLPPHMVEQGLGHRHDFPRSGRAFDVISPKGQTLIASLWSQALKDYEAETGGDALIGSIRAGLHRFKAGRSCPLGTAGEVRWVLDRFRDVRLDVAAKALEVSPALVTRYAKQRSKQIDHLKKMLKAPLEQLSAIERMRRRAMLKDDEV